MPLRLAPSCKPPGMGCAGGGCTPSSCSLGCKSSEVVFILLLLKTFRPSLQPKPLLRLRLGLWGTSPLLEPAEMAAAASPQAAVLHAIGFLLVPSLPSCCASVCRAWWDGAGSRREAEAVPGVFGSKASEQGVLVMELTLGFAGVGPPGLSADTELDYSTFKPCAGIHLDLALLDLG